MEWISVEDRLPEADTPGDRWIAAFNADGAFPARYHADVAPYFENLLEIYRDGDPEWYWLDVKYGVNHWMPLPDPSEANDAT